MAVAAQGNLTGNAFQLLNAQINAANTQARVFGQIAASIQPPTQNLNQGLASLAGGMGALRTAAAGTLTGILAFKALDIVASGLGAVKDGFLSAAQSANDFNAAQSTARVGMTALLGSAALSNEMMLRIRESQGALIVGPASMAKWAQQMLNAGAAANTVLPTIDNLLGGLSKAGNLTQETADRAVLALSQMATKGKVNAQDIRQLAENGIPAWRLLSESMGITTAEVMKMSEQGLIPATALMDALQASGNKDQLKKGIETAAGASLVLHSRLATIGGDLEKPVYDRFEKILSAVAKTMSDPTLGQGVATAAALIESMIAPLDGIGGLLSGIDGMTVNWGQTLMAVAKIAVAAEAPFELAARVAGGLIKILVAGAEMALAGFVVFGNQVVNSLTMASQVAGALKDGNLGAIPAIIETANAKSELLTKTWHDASIDLAKGQLDGALIVKNAWADTVNDVQARFKLIDKLPTPARTELPGAAPQAPPWTAQQAKDLADLEYKLAQFGKDQVKINADADREITAINKGLNSKLFDIWQAREDRNERLTQKAAEDEATYARETQKVHTDLAAWIADKKRSTGLALKDAAQGEADADRESARKRMEIAATLAEDERTIAEKLSVDLAKIDGDAVQARQAINGAMLDRQRQYLSDFLTIQADASNQQLQQQQDFDQRYEDQRVAVHQKALDALAALDESQAQARSNYAYEREQRTIQEISDFNYQSARQNADRRLSIEKQYEAARANLAQQAAEASARFQQQQLDRRVDSERNFALDAEERKLQAVEDMQLQRQKMQRRGQDTSGLDEELRLKLLDIGDEDVVAKARLERQLKRDEIEAQIVFQRQAARDNAAAAAKIERDHQLALAEATAAEEQDKVDFQSKLAREIAQDAARFAAQQAREAELAKQKIAIDEQHNLEILAGQQAVEQAKLNVTIAAEQEKTKQALAELWIREIAARAKDTRDLAAIDENQRRDIAAVTAAADHDREQAIDRANKAVAEIARVDGERQVKYEAQVTRITDEAKYDTDKATEAATARLAELNRVELDRQAKYQQALIDSADQATKEAGDARQAAADRIIEIDRVRDEQIQASKDATAKFLLDKGDEIRILQDAKTAYDNYNSSIETEKRLQIELQAEIQQTIRDTVALNLARGATPGPGTGGYVAPPALTTLPHRAGGGPVQAFQTYLVGEQGPELFTAPANGHIMSAAETAAAKKRAAEVTDTQAQRNWYENQIAANRGPNGDGNRAAALLAEYLPKLKEWAAPGGLLDPRAQKPHYAAPEVGPAPSWSSMGLPPTPPAAWSSGGLPPSVPAKARTTASAETVITINVQGLMTGTPEQLAKALTPAIRAQLVELNRRVPGLFS